MGKMKKFKSLKWSFFIHLFVCFLISFFGSMAIGFGTNSIQDWYKNLHSDVRLIYTDNEINVNVYETYVITDKRPIAEKKYRTIYFIISNAQMVVTPIWIILCVAVTGAIFYRRELKKPILILLDASNKIADNQLDFQIEYKSENEFGQLCSAFEKMRQTLDKNNHKMWRSLEERKLLNSAFSHDLRTPLTVLKGYNDFLLKYSDKATEDKKKNVLEMMSGQIDRLESYTYKMSAVQKLEDISPNISEVSAENLCESFKTVGIYLCKDLTLNFNADLSSNSYSIDMELVSEVYENIVSNAVRYAENKIEVEIVEKDVFMIISVRDDGKGFSETALQFAKKPFYRGETEQNSTHFGLGLYICSIICEKLGGSLTISNSETGGKVTAEFFSKSR